MKKLGIWWRVAIAMMLFLSSLILSFFASADSADPNGYYVKYLKPTLESKIPVIIVIVIVMAIFTLNEGVKVPLREDIEYLKEENKDYKQTIKDNSLDILANLKSMQKLHRREKLFEFIKNYTLSNPYAVAVQIYRYTMKHTLSHTEYKVNYIEGYVRENEEVNSITQAYYKIGRRVSKQFYEAYIQFIEDNNSTKLDNFIEKYVNKINQKAIQSIEEKDSITYSLILYLLDVVSETPGFGNATPRIDDPEKEDLLHKMKRTGILRGIINDHFYEFDYLGCQESKKDRKYITFCKTINKVDYLFLVTFSPPNTIFGTKEESYIETSLEEFANDCNNIEI